MPARVFITKSLHHNYDSVRIGEVMANETKPYRVLHGWSSHTDFATFREALDFYRQTHGAGPVLNMDRYDGAPDGSDGLTEEEREAVELS
jgi:hypothetical protein